MSLNKRIDGGAARLAELAGRDPGRVVDRRTGRELVLLQALAQQRREAPRLVGMGARAVEGAERLLALRHVAHRRRQLDLGYLRACLGELRRRIVHGRRALGRQLRLVMGEAHGDARRPVELGDRPVRHRHQRGAKQGDVLDAARIGADRVEPLGVGLHAGGGEMAVARLVADDAAEGGRPDHRAAGLRAGRQHDLEVGDGGGRARRGAARRVRGIVRVPRRPGMTVGEFGGDRLAEQDRALAPWPARSSRRRRAAGASCRSASRRSSAGPPNR